MNERMIENLPPLVNREPAIVRWGRGKLFAARALVRAVLRNRDFLAEVRLHLEVSA